MAPAKKSVTPAAAVKEEETLTERQRAVFDYIQNRISAWGYPPTIREIGEHLGIRSTNGVADHLKALKRKGYLQHQEMKSRTLMPIHKETAKPSRSESSSFMSVPILGRVAAGTPILAVEQAETTLKIDPQMLDASGDVFALTVAGESMIEAGILDGDTVFVRRKKSANTGEMVVAMIDGEVTVKRFYHEGQRIRLQPANQAMQPIYVHASDWRDVEILGVVVGVFRKV